MKSNQASNTQETDRPRRLLLRILVEYWIQLLGVLTLIWLFAAPYPNMKYLHSDAGKCLANAFSWPPGLPGCAENLRAAIYSVASSTPPHTALFQGNMPVFLMWADNLFVDVYTLFFIASAGLAYKKLTSVKADPILLWRAAITATCILALLGAFVDHAENFWILAYMEPDPSTVQPSYKEQLGHVAIFSAIKFLLFFINVIVAALWWLRVLYRYRWEKRRYELMRSLLDDTSPVRLRELLGLARPNDDRDWPDEMALKSLIVPDPRTQVWLGTFFYHFVRERDSVAALRYSFSIHAIRRWKQNLSLVPNDAERAPMYSDELRRFLNVLANNGYLTPKGARFEVTWSTFRERAPDPNAGSESNASAEDTSRDIRRNDESRRN